MNNHTPFALESRMAGVTVNLDALIPREDFESDGGTAGGRLRDTISLSDLEESGFFHPLLRKPDFQRETTHWKPEVVRDLVKAYLDGHLIPAVILWQSGDRCFVIDGAHRLSALIAWTRDDYGDGEASNAKFGRGLSQEQRRVADRTRSLIRKEIGSYAEFKGLRGQDIADPQKARWVKRIGAGAVEIQWVTATTSQAAEDSFFKINQAAQPIDPTERRILQTRRSPNSVAARCIARGGRGHKYWGEFEPQIQESIEALGDEISKILYEPPHKQPITSTDVPIAGQGYNALPFVFELVSICNGIPIPTSATAKKLPPPLPEDLDGSETLTLMRSVRKSLGILSTNDSGSLGLHPLIYCYSSTGSFQANAFLATLRFAERLDERKKKKEFTSVRKDMELFLLLNRKFVSLTVNRLGAGARSLERIVDLYWEVFQLCLAGKRAEEILSELIKKSEFSHLRQFEVPSPGAENAPSKNGASASSKSASFIQKAMTTPLRCPECGAALHANSMTFDHRQRRADGGSNRSDNLDPMHPFCNSGVKA
ncbi:MAG: DUF262 domain-containing protein [Roseicyclus sp.]|nr:DUF262 domain-containing protein [Roseicyclus sp.]MBO6624509.1 DUF262 domain-containing protein [Roseicyclus sp.]MBO6921204.1 DUF262 domain-containing protein [Roseicyclus sp.]